MLNDDVKKFFYDNKTLLETNDIKTFCRNCLLSLLSSEDRKTVFQLLLDNDINIPSYYDVFNTEDFVSIEFPKSIEFSKTAGVERVYNCSFYDCTFKSNVLFIDTPINEGAFYFCQFKGTTYIDALNFLRPHSFNKCYFDKLVLNVDFLNFNTCIFEGGRIVQLELVSSHWKEEHVIFITKLFNDVGINECNVIPTFNYRGI